MQKPMSQLSVHDVTSATSELLRCLMITMLAKRMLSYEEIDVVVEFAKKRLNSDVYDPRVRQCALAYFDLFVHSLQLDPQKGSIH